jgi:glycosyltransferase involved in cell wall biosynthesis
VSRIARACETRTRPRICFVSGAGYGALARDPRVALVGGAEVQQSLLAPELARRGYEVSMVTMDFGQDDAIDVEGVKVLKTHTPDEGLPGLRFLHPRLTSTWAAMARADADVYYQRCAGAATGIVAAFAQRHRRRFVFAAACDLDFDPLLPLVGNARDRLLCRYGLRRADAVIVQTGVQQALCRQVLAREGVEIRSCYRPTGQPARHDGPVIWVGTLKDIKRPELFVELAARLRHRRFIMVGGSYDDSGRLEALRARAAALGNLECVGHVHYAKIETQFDGGAVFVNTSSSEGFPNTFLQAWSRGMPTVSFFDPQVEFEGRPVAQIAPDLESMVAQVEALLAAPALWADRGQLARRCFEQRYSLDAAVSGYESVIQGLWADEHKPRLA